MFKLSIKPLSHFYNKSHSIVPLFLLFIAGCGASSSRPSLSLTKALSSPQETSQNTSVNGSPIYVGDTDFPWTQTCTLNYSIQLIKEIDTWSNHESTSPKASELRSIKETLWAEFENHPMDHKKLFHHLLQTSFFSESHNHTAFSNRIESIPFVKCSNLCKNVPLDKIYESIFAIILLKRKSNHALPPEAIRQVFLKILNGLNETVLERSLESWGTASPAYGVANRPLLSPEEKITRVKSVNDIALFIDFFSFYSSNHLSNGMSRDQTYAHAIAPLKGKKITSLVQPKQFVGLVEDDHFIEPTIPAYPHPIERDRWVSQSSPFLRFMEERQLPIACSISGNTNIHLWGLVDVSSPLSPHEIRIYLFALWATLVGDGGHSLQEILSSAKEVSQYLSTQPLSKNASWPRPEFIQALSEATQSIAPIGNGIGHYHHDFFSHFDHDRWFQEIRKEAQDEFKDFWAQHCAETPSTP